MLIHLLNPDHGFAMFRPPEQGPPRMSPSSKEFSVIDLCDPAGQSLPVGSNRLRSETIVTMRDQSGRYVVPRNDKVKLEFVTSNFAKFLLRKVGGGVGDVIRHGDAIALGAFQAQPARYRWLQLDSHLGLGGSTKTYGGSSQRPRLLELNSVDVFSGVGVSDLVPPSDDGIRFGSMTIAVSHEGVWKDSFFDVRVTSVLAARHKIGRRQWATLPAGEAFDVRIREGERTVTVPLAFEAPVNDDPCMQFVNGARLATIDVTHRPGIPWDRPGREATKSIEVQFRPLFDAMTLTAGEFELNGDQWVGIHRALATGAFPAASPFVLTVENGAEALPAGSWRVACEVEPLVIPGSPTTATTPTPPFQPAEADLQIGPDGVFAHEIAFGAAPAQTRGHVYCCTVRLFRPDQDQPTFKRRFALSQTNI